MSDDFIKDDIDVLKRRTRRMGIKISELEKDNKRIREKIKGFQFASRQNFNGIESKIAELKEWQGWVKERISFAMNQDITINTIKEVLREYFEYRKVWSEKIMKKNAIFGFNDALNTWMMISLHKFSSKVLEKLEGSPESPTEKTEKKCVVKDCKLIGTDNQCKNCPDWNQKKFIALQTQTEGHMKRGTKDLSMKELVESIEKDSEKEVLNVLKPIKAGDTVIVDVGDKVIIKKDSGGEKEGGISDVSPAEGKSYGGFLPDSKPAEPKCEYLWEQFGNVKRCKHNENFQPSMRLDGETPGFCTVDKCPLKKEDRLPGGTGNEPRENNVEWIEGTTGAKEVYNICKNWNYVDKSCVSDGKFSFPYDIVVKREDLQRWKFFLEKYNFHDDVKKIEEEYNL